jgi:hypothetical protein
MRRYQAAAAVRPSPRSFPADPFLNCGAVGLTVTLGDDAGETQGRALLVQIPEDWHLAGVEDRSFETGIETVRLRDGDSHGIPAGRYLRLAIDPLLDPWGRVMVGLSFETPDGPRHAELTVQTREEKPVMHGAGCAKGIREPKGDGIRLTAERVLELGRKAQVLFVDGGRGDVLDLRGDRRGNWAQGDSDGVHTLFLRSTRAGKRSILLAVRNGVAVKLKQS